MAIFYTDSASFNDVSVTGSLSFAANSGGLTGSLLGTSSWAESSSVAISSSFSTTSSAATSITFTPSSASFATTASAATSITFTPTSASFSTTASFATTSSYVNPLGLPSGSVSASSFSSPNQGTVRATINGVNSDVDTGLQTGDSPTFTGLTLSGLTNTTNANLVLVRDTGTGQIFTTASVGGGGSGNAFPYDGRTTPAIISGSLIVSASLNTPGINVTGSINILSGSVTASSSDPEFYVSSSRGVDGYFRAGLAADTAPGLVIGSRNNVSLYFDFTNDTRFQMGYTQFIPQATDINLGATNLPWNNIYARNVSSSFVTASIVSASQVTSSGGFFGTSSWATNAVSASYFSGSVDFPSGITGSITNATSASYALTASFASNAGGGSGFPFSGSAIITGSMIVSSSGIQVIGNGITGSISSGSFFNILELSMAVSGTIAANASTTVTLDLNKSNYYTVSASAAGTVTWVVNNAPPAGRAQTFVVEYTNGGIKTNNWFTGTRWPAGVAPTLSSASANPDMLSFTTDDAGTNWRGVLLQRGSA